MIIWGFSYLFEVGADALVVGAVDEQPSHAGGAYFTKRDFLEDCFRTVSE
jgi:hypothetical protein